MQTLLLGIYIDETYTGARSLIHTLYGADLTYLTNMVCA